MDLVSIQCEEESTNIPSSLRQNAHAVERRGPLSCQYEIEFAFHSVVRFADIAAAPGGKMLKPSRYILSFVAATLFFAGIVACAKNTPYVPVVDVQASDPLYQAIFVNVPSGNYSDETVFPDENDRHAMAVWAKGGNGFQRDMQSKITWLFNKNNLAAQNKGAAKYLLDIEIVKLSYKTARPSIDYQIDFIYKIKSTSNGSAVFETRVADQGSEQMQYQDVDLAMNKVYHLVIDANVGKALPQIRAALASAK